MRWTAPTPGLETQREPKPISSQSGYPFRSIVATADFSMGKTSSGSAAGPPESARATRTDSGRLVMDSPGWQGTRIGRRAYAACSGDAPMLPGDARPVNKKTFALPVPRVTMRLFPLPLSSPVGGCLMTAHLRPYLLAALAAALALAPAAAQERESKYPKVNVATAYVVDPHWPQKPEGARWAAMPGVAVDAHDNVYLFTRADPPVQVYDASGKFVRSWGDA